MNTVSYTITSSTGEQHFSDIPTKKALTDIKKVVKKESKWLFVDGAHKDPNTITEKELDKGTVIILTDTLMGG